MGKEERILQLYTKLINDTLSYSKKNNLKIVNTQCKKTVVEFLEKYPHLIDFRMSNKLETKFRSGSEEELKIAMKDYFQLFRDSLKRIMGESADGIIRNAVKKTFTEKKTEIVALGLEFPEWFVEQMKKIEVKSRVESFFGG